MAASDTLIGITGAVLLVGVMVGVFVYEYNSADGGGGNGDPAALQNATTSFDGDLDPGLGLVEPAVLGEYTFSINASVTQFRVSGNISETAPGTGSVTIRLIPPDGGSPASVEGSAGTFSLGVDRPAEGTWTLRFSTEAAFSGGSYTGELKTTYESA